MFIVFVKFVQKKMFKNHAKVIFKHQNIAGGAVIRYSALISLIYLILGSRSFQQWELLAPAPIDVSVVNLLLDNQPTVKVKIFFVNKGNFHYVNFVPCLCCRNLKVTFIEKLLLKIPLADRKARISPSVLLIKW